MSYCRFSDADAYLFPSDRPVDIPAGTEHRFIVCCACSFYVDRPDPEFTTVADALAHVAAHRADGDRIPDYADDGIRRDEGWLERGEAMRP